MLDGRPSHVGVATIRISEPRTFSWITGQPSPAPSSEVTPGFTSWSTTRTTSVSTPCSDSASITTPASASVFEVWGEGLRVQFRMIARKVAPFSWGREDGSTYPDLALGAPGSTVMARLPMLGR